MTLTEFLQARITEDEAAAPAVADELHPHATVHLVRSERRTRLLAVALDLRCPTCHAEVGEGCSAMTPHHSPKPADEQHAQRMDLARVEFRRRYGVVSVWGQARVLAECEAKRRIVERVGFLIDEPDGLGNLCEGILMDLALPYADHPDFRGEWRVS